MKKVSIIGAIAGDVIGSIYEFNPTKNYNFRLLDERMEITDDSIMTIAVADWVLHDSLLSSDGLVNKMRTEGQKRLWPMGGYGGNFLLWLACKNPQPYNSWGNGSAMRVSACGFTFDTIEKTLEAAKKSAEVTHNHPEGIKGAQATAAAIFMARNGARKEDIRTYITQTYGYDLARTCNDIRPKYEHMSSCQETVPQAIIAFLDSKDFEDAIRLTVSLGGDADTMGTITGAIAAAYYREIPDEIYDFVISKIPDDLKDIVMEFENKVNNKNK
jgi:ADP-ribosyl-[dinitrogen reductase] hydrolase